MNALATDQNALRKIMRESMPQDIGTPDLGKSLDVLNRGYVAGTLGGPVDLVSMLLGHFGYNVEKPVGGSEWIGQKMQDMGMVSDRRYPAEELLAGLVNPIPAGIFAGKGAKMADMAKLLMAEGMLSKGDDAADVWRATGWGKGPDGKWRFEIPDDEARFKPVDEWGWGAREDYKDGNRVTASLDEVYNHDKFAENYQDGIWGFGGPNGKRHVVSIAPNNSEAGSFSNGVISVGREKDIPNNETMLHELQHAIQEREGFARGGSPSAPYQGNQRMQVARSLYEDMRASPANAGDSDDAIFAHALKIADSDIGREKGYKRLAGEAESRLTQARMNLTPEERLLSYPWDADYFEQMTGVPIDRLIYRYNE